MPHSFKSSFVVILHFSCIVLEFNSPLLSDFYLNFVSFEFSKPLNLLLIPLFLLFTIVRLSNVIDLSLLLKSSLVLKVHHSEFLLESVPCFLFISLGFGGSREGASSWSFFNNAFDQR